MPEGRHTPREKQSLCKDSGCGAEQGDLPRSVAVRMTGVKHGFLEELEKAVLVSGFCEELRRSLTDWDQTMRGLERYTQEHKYSAGNKQKSLTALDQRFAVVVGEWWGLESGLEETWGPAYLERSKRSYLKNRVNTKSSQPEEMQDRGLGYVLQGRKMGFFPLHHHPPPKKKKSFPLSVHETMEKL